MPERDLLTYPLGGGWQLKAGGIVRERDGRLVGDMILQNGVPVYSDRIALAEPAARAAFAAAATAGCGLSFEQVIDEALAALSEAEADLSSATPSQPAAARRGELLSPREREVLTLVAEGRSNKQIAEALYVAPSTAKYHVTSLLNKLGADTRAQVVAVAAQRGLF